MPSSPSPSSPSPVSTNFLTKSPKAPEIAKSTMDNISLLNIDASLEDAKIGHRLDTKYMSSTAASIASSEGPDRAVVNLTPTVSVMSPLSRSSSGSALSTTAARDGLDGGIHRGLLPSFRGPADKEKIAMRNQESDSDTDNPVSEDELDRLSFTAENGFGRSVTPPSRLDKRKIINLNENSVRKPKSPLAKDVILRDSYESDNSSLHLNPRHKAFSTVSRVSSDNDKSLTAISNMSISSQNPYNNVISSTNNHFSTRISQNLPNEPPITLSEKMNLLKPKVHHHSLLKKAVPPTNPSIFIKDDIGISSHNNSLSNISMILPKDTQDIIVDEPGISKVSEQFADGHETLFNPAFNRLVHMTSLSTVGGISDFEDDESVLSGYR